MAGFRDVAGRHRAARLDSTLISSTYFPFVELLSTVATILVLWAGAALVAGGSLEVGPLFAFVLYLTVAFAPIQQLSQVFDTYQQGRVAMDRITDLLDVPVSVPRSEHPVDPGRLAGAIELDHVSFRYRGAPDDALRDVSLAIAAGETVAFVGETGAGKSTLVKLAARLYDPTAGRILVDGRPLVDLDLEAFRQQLGFVPQEAFLFTGTIRDNIAYARPDATDAEVEAAARAVGAHDFVSRLPSGYHQPVVERGRSLSAGQRQLIALARAQPGPGDPGAGRGHGQPRPGHRGPGGAGHGDGQPGPHDAADRPPAAVGGPGRPHRHAGGGRVVEVGPHDELVARRPLRLPMGQLPGRRGRHPGSTIDGVSHGAYAT